jgi:hypothetical protein
MVETMTSQKEGSLIIPDKLILLSFIQVILIFLGGFFVVSVVTTHDVILVLGVAIFLYAKKWMDSTRKKWTEGSL